MGEGGFNPHTVSLNQPAPGRSPVRMRAVETLSPAPLHADGANARRSLVWNWNRLEQVSVSY